MTNYIIAGAVFGLSIGTKFNLAIIILPFIIMYIYYEIIRNLPRKDKIKFMVINIINKKLIAFTGTALLVFFIKTPGILFRFI